MLYKHLSRLTSSARGENFNILIYPFLIATLSYGIGFSLLTWSSGVNQSSLFLAMTSLGLLVPVIWGIGCLLTIVLGVTFLLFHLPPAGRISGLIGFMVWIFAMFCWAVTGGYLLMFSVALPNMYFWFWQYFSLSKFRREETEDRQTIIDYNHGDYDDELNPKDSKIEREDNRGKDIQSYGSYIGPDDGVDFTRSLD